MKLTQEIIRELIKKELSGNLTEASDQEIAQNAITQISNLLVRLESEGLNAQDILNKAKRAYESSEESSASLGEKLSKDADAGEYVDDFRDSDAPQFKGKSKKKKQQMAVAAYLDAQED